MGETASVREIKKIDKIKVMEKEHTIVYHMMEKEFSPYELRVHNGGHFADCCIPEIIEPLSTNESCTPRGGAHKVIETYIEMIRAQVIAVVHESNRYT